MWVSPSNARLFDWCQFQIYWLSSISNKLIGRSFKYGVSDALSGAEFGHEESEDGAGSRVSIVGKKSKFLKLTNNYLITLEYNKGSFQKIKILLGGNLLSPSAGRTSPARQLSRKWRRRVRVLIVFIRFVIFFIWKEEC